MDSKKVERRHSSTLEGKAISGPQLKTNTCLLTSPLSWLVKSQRNDVCIGTLPLPRSVSPSKPKALTGSDGGRVESWTRAKLEKKGTGIGSHVGLGQEEFNVFLGGQFEST